jgi:proteasome alpha subunit
MSIPFYVSPEQLMADKAEYARKGIARGRSIVSLEYDKGIVLVAENPSSLSKIGEIYDRIAFAGVGKFSEFDQLRKLGIRFCDVRGYQYSREDVRAKALANAYSQAIGDVFTQQMKPLEVEVIVAEVGDPRFAGHEENVMYRVQHDGTISDHHGYCGIGGAAERLETYLKDHYQAGQPLGDALKVGVAALVAASNGGARIAAERLEICTLDRERQDRKFRRASADEVAAILG